ncbi:MAG: hypothetical protein SPK94_07895 [Bacteroidales bacterium]|nr:hypothetical protein [Bacteroidales bacterium]
MKNKEIKFKVFSGEDFDGWVSFDKNTFELLQSANKGLAEELADKDKMIEELKHQLAEKDEEIEELKESNRVTKALYKNYYTQLQNYKSKLYDIDIPKLRKKHLTPEEKEIYYKGFENCERQFASHIADITIELRHQVCEEIKNALYMNFEYDDEYDQKFVEGIIDQIEKGEKDD